ncbi:MAG: sensor domain-containing diguanylate cyclase [Gallionella sp.]
MSGHLQSENYSLRQQLESLLHEARRNENKMRRFDQLQRQLIGADSLPELIRLLLSEYKLAFGVEFVALALVDHEYEITRIMENECDKTDCGGLTLHPSTAPLEALYQGITGPCLGVFDATIHQALFDSAPGEIASVALLPLMRHGELIGSLHFGSADPSRYVAGCGTDFLERLTEIIAICLENALSQEQLKLLGMTDALTGVSNRRYFDHRCQIEVSQSRRQRRPLVCMLLDIDKFKRINDTYGHQTGDEALMSTASAIQSQLRAGDTLARFGGEEFVVLLPHTDMHPARQIAERIRCCIAAKELHAPNGEPINLTISIGLSLLPVDSHTAKNQALIERMLAAADKALYRAKHEGRNRVICDDSLPDDEARATNRMQSITATLKQLPTAGVSMLKALKRTLALSK